MDGERALPGQASLRYLKVEAKRRHAAGEFATLHEAQLAIAREHGQRSWAALREAVGSAAGGSEGHAVAQLRWIAARFRGAGEPGWAAPGEDELREHFTAEFLAAVPAGQLVAAVAGIAPELREDLVVAADLPFFAQATIAGRLIAAAAEPRPPCRLLGLQARPLGERISDPRAAAPPAAADGPVPEKVPELAAVAATRFGLAGLALAGASAPGQVWTATAGPTPTSPRSGSATTR